MSNCNNTTQLPTTTTGAQGDPGANGSDGQPGGIFGKWIYSTSTVVSPATSEIRFNNTSSSLVTEVYVSKTGRSSVDYADTLASFENSGGYGRFTIFKEFDSTKFWSGVITSVIDNGTYYTYVIDNIDSSNATIPTNIFSAGEVLVLTYVADGLSGTSGSTASSLLLYNEPNQSGSITGGSPVTWNDFIGRTHDLDYSVGVGSNIPKSLQDNEILKVEIIGLALNQGSSQTSGVRLDFNGVILDNMQAVGSQGFNVYILQYEISRIDATTISVKAIKNYRSTTGVSWFVTGFTSYVVPDMDNAVSTLKAQGNSESSTAISCLKFTINLEKL